LTLIATGLYILAAMCYQLEIAKELINDKNVFVKNCSQVKIERKRKEFVFKLNYLELSKCNTR